MKNIAQLVVKAHAQSTKSGFWNHDKSCLHGGCGVLIEGEKHEFGVQEPSVQCESLDMHSDHDPGPNPGPCVCVNRDLSMKVILLHSELSEALEDYRSGIETHGPFSEIYYIDKTNGERIDAARAAQLKVAWAPHGAGHYHQRLKPVGLLVELGDAAIRTFDLIGFFGLGHLLSAEYEKLAAARGAKQSRFSKMLEGCHYSLAQVTEILSGADVKEDDVNDAFAATTVLAMFLLMLEATLASVGGTAAQLDEAIEVKMAYNASREFMHGKVC